MATGGNVTFEIVSEYLAKVQALGLSPVFWTKIGYIISAASIIYFLSIVYKWKKETDRDLGITTGLVTSNTTPDNVVQLATPSEIEKILREIEEGKITNAKVVRR